MSQSRSLTAVVYKEDEVFVSHCPELDIASQGRAVQEAQDHLREAVELFFEVADQAEVDSRLHPDVVVSRFEVPVG